MVEFWQLIFMESPMELRMLMAFFLVALIWSMFKRTWALIQQPVHWGEIITCWIWGQVGKNRDVVPQVFWSLVIGEIKTVKKEGWSSAWPRLCWPTDVTISFVADHQQTKERFIKSPFKVYLMDRNTIAWRSVQLSGRQAASNRHQATSLTSNKLQDIMGLEREGKKWT